MFDGKEVYWYHVNCFFKEPLEPIESVLHFDGFCNLRFEDQERLKRLMSEFCIFSSSKNYNGINHIYLIRPQFSI